MSDNPIWLKYYQQGVSWTSSQILTKDKEYFSHLNQIVFVNTIPANQFYHQIRGIKTNISLYLTVARLSPWPSHFTASPLGWILLRRRFGGDVPSAYPRPIRDGTTLLHLAAGHSSRGGVWCAGTDWRSLHSALTRHLCLHDVQTADCTESHRGKRIAETMGNGMILIRI